MRVSARTSKKALAIIATCETQMEAYIKLQHAGCLGGLSAAVWFAYNSLPKA
jgi:hypothetical protein